MEEYILTLDDEYIIYCIVSDVMEIYYNKLFIKKCFGFKISP